MSGEVESSLTVTGAIGGADDGKKLCIGGTGDCLTLAEQPASGSGSARERDHTSDGHDRHSLVLASPTENSPDFEVLMHP